MKTGIAAEARQKIKQLLVPTRITTTTAFNVEVDAIIQSAIEEATKPLEKALQKVSAALLRAESRAAHSLHASARASEVATRHGEQAMRRIAEEALTQFEEAVETDGPPLDSFERGQFLEAVKSAISKATRLAYEKAYADVSQDMAEAHRKGNAFFGRAAHASECEICGIGIPHGHTHNCNTFTLQPAHANEETAFQVTQRRLRALQRTKDE